MERGESISWDNDITNIVRGSSLDIQISEISDMTLMPHVRKDKLLNMCINMTNWSCW